jgi:hypothetical protein
MSVNRKVTNLMLLALPGAANGSLLLWNCVHSKVKYTNSFYERDAFLVDS